MAALSSQWVPTGFLVTWNLKQQPPPVPPSPQRLGELTQLTLFFPACGYKVGQFPVFVCQLQFAVAQAGLSSEALLRQAPVGGQHHLPVHLKILKLNKNSTKCLIRYYFFPPYQHDACSHDESVMHAHLCTRDTKLCREHFKSSIMKIHKINSNSCNF